MKRCANCDDEFPDEELDENLLCEECAEEAAEADEAFGDEDEG